MAAEPRRACGYRKIGGTYLEAPAGGFGCGRMPLVVQACPLCEHRPPFTRGIQRITPKILLAAAPECRFTLKDLTCTECPLGRAMAAESAGLMWVGDRFYTPDTFLVEARELGVSKRVPSVPRWLVPGKTWVFLAHMKAGSGRCRRCTDGRVQGQPGEGLVHCVACDGTGTARVPAVFTAFVPTRVVRIVPDDMPEESREALRKQGFTPVAVPAGDPDHKGRDKS
jgi:hypothetical protein